MKRFVLTGTPGSGKTAILRQLELDGFGVVEEAATDVIALSQARGVAEPWTDPSFIDTVVRLQGLRRTRADHLPGSIQFHDRCAVCTAALATYLGYPISDALARELDQLATEGLYERQVFFIHNLGFVAPTEARRISFEESLRFERIHEETYRNLGFELIDVAPGPLADRLAAIKHHLPGAPGLPVRPGR